MSMIRSLMLVVGFTLSAQTWAVDLPDFTGLVKSLSPAVVNISTINAPKTDESQPEQFRGPNGEEIPDIFRDFFRGFQGPGGTPRANPQSLGSGFIISADGYVLTNHHVVEGADKVMVRMNDRREIEAEVIGSDKRSDVALLKIDGKDLPTVEIGSSDALEVGEWVLAIGSPFGFDATVTAGIVSAKERSLAGDSYVPFIQTDVAINPGNSGGPLFNLDGEVVGINSQIYTRSGGFMGLSFAIPMDVAMEVADQLREQGYVDRGWLGVIIQEVTRDLAESFGLDKPSGALVAQVLPDSPAEAAGLQEGDVIIGFNGREIGLSSELPAQVGRVAPGKSAEVDIYRDGKTLTVEVEIGLLPSQEELAQSRMSPEEPRKSVSLGLNVRDLTDEDRERFDVTTGVLVEGVSAGPAAQAGVNVGDIITTLGGESVDSVSTLRELVDDLPTDRPAPLRIIRSGSPVYLALRIE